MNVILLEKINNLGVLGDQVKVKAGYGRNFLIPQGKALPATATNVELFEARRADLEQKAQEALDAAKTRAGQLQDKEFVIVRKAGDEGKMFGSVTNHDIAEIISAAGTSVEKREVRMPSGAIRDLGEYQITLHLHTDVDVEVKLLIQPE